MTDFAQAILAIKPDSDFHITNLGDINSIVWVDGNPSNITNSQIETKLAELQAEYDSLAYARKRQIKYPSTKDFMEAYTEKEIGGDSTKWDAYIVNYNKVRTENPK